MSSTWQVDFNSPITITPREVGLRIHLLRYNQTLDDHAPMSCPCNQLAMFYLGIRETTGMFWPDGKGGNTWTK